MAVSLLIHNKPGVISMPCDLNDLVQAITDFGEVLVCFSMGEFWEGAMVEDFDEGDFDRIEAILNVPDQTRLPIRVEWNDIKVMASYTRSVNSCDLRFRLRDMQSREHCLVALALDSSAWQFIGTRLVVDSVAASIVSRRQELEILEGPYYPEYTESLFPTLGIKIPPSLIGPS